VTERAHDEHFDRESQRATRSTEPATTPTTTTKTSLQPFHHEAAPQKRHVAGRAGREGREGSQAPKICTLAITTATLDPTTMAKIGRNEPCPCGSGKKYKKCCLAAQSAPALPITPRLEPGGWMPVEDSPDLLSNSVVDLLDEKRFDEALAACERLRVEYPELPDWLERSGAVHEARGDLPLARDFYQRALDFTELPEQRAGFDEDGRAFFRRKLASLDARIATR